MFFKFVYLQSPCQLFYEYKTRKTGTLLLLILLQSIFFTSCQLVPLLNLENDTLNKTYDTFRASLQIIEKKGVHHDYIHQVIYFRDLLNAMNRAIDSDQQMETLKKIAHQLNDLTTPSSLANAWIATTINFQIHYYKLPTKEAPDILGRKAVGTAIYLQYLSPLLDKTNKNLNKAKIASIENFNRLNNKGFDKLKNVTKAYYAQASTVDKAEMNIRFEWEKNAIESFKEPLDQFYKK